MSSIRRTRNGQFYFNGRRYDSHAAAFRALSARAFRRPPAACSNCGDPYCPYKEDNTRNAWLVDSQGRPTEPQPFMTLRLRCPF